MAGQTKQRQANIQDTSDAWGRFQHFVGTNLPKSGNKLIDLISLAGGKRGY